MIAGEKENSIFFNHSFDKKRLKALISWVFKKSGEAEALRVLDLLKETGFRHATRAGISIGLHDLTTPATKSWLISESQQSMNSTYRDFIGAKITATERSQRIIDTWHRASESLSKQVVDYFGIYDTFNPVYIMALSGARGNFSQVRQLIGMRGLMADQQGKIVNFPIRSNLREGLTITEYFISCSGARKGLVDTALRTADTGYLTRRLVDVSHHVVVKRIRCNTDRGIAFKDLQSYNKILLSLKERLVGRVLAENVFVNDEGLTLSEVQTSTNKKTSIAKQGHNNSLVCKSFNNLIAKKDKEISPQLALQITKHRSQVLIRSPLTCGFTHEVCQLCYGWSISQGNLVSLGDAVGVIAAQSIGEPGTQLTMRTFHTGGVFSGDLLQEVRAPHAGRIEFSKAFQGLLIRTGHGHIAFLSKTKGSLILIKNDVPPCTNKAKRTNLRTNVRLIVQKEKAEPNFTTIPIQPFTMLFVRQGEQVEKNSLLAEFSIQRKEGNQPIKTEQTLFAELSGRIIEDCSGKTYLKYLKESSLLVDTLRDYMSRWAYHSSNKNQVESLYNNPYLNIQSTANKYKSSYKSEICTYPSLRFVKAKSKQKKLTVQDISKTQPLTSYKAEDLENDLFRYIEPVKSGRLGFLKILSTRIGATFDYQSPIKSFDLSKYLQNSFFYHNVPQNIFTPLKESNFRPSTFKSSYKYKSSICKEICTYTGVPYSAEPYITPFKSKKKKNEIDSRICTYNRFLKQAKKGWLKQNIALKDFEKHGITAKYLHPESIKDNLFFLQTIAEYGDIVDEGYKNQIL